MVNNRYTLASAMFICGLLFQSPGLLAQLPRAAEKEEADPVAPGIWAKMEFGDERKLRQARIVITESVPISDREVVKKSIDITDPKTLELLERALMRAHIAVPKKAGALSGVLPTKRIELTTSKENFNVQVFEMSFALSDKPLSFDSQRSFHSTWLAYLLDALLRKHGADGLSEKSLSGLSGEFAIKADVAQIKKILSESSALNDR